MGKPTAFAVAKLEVITRKGYILVFGWVPRELKHLSNARKRNHMRFRQ